MIYMPANSSNAIVHYWAGKWPGSVGWLVSPPHTKTKLRPWLPYALDNGAYSAFTSGKPWNADAWWAMLQWAKASGFTPQWALCPDVVANREATLKQWPIYSPLIHEAGWRCAFAVQDGMTAADVPPDADVVFVGGSTEWKWRTAAAWAQFPHVHIGRVNSIAHLDLCRSLGVKSCDGSGWFRREPERFQQLIDWMERNNPQ